MTIRHKQYCQRLDDAVERWVGRLGDPMIRCTSCKSYAIDKKPEPSGAESAPLTSTYFCRAHYNPVTFKGRGCPECATEMAAAKARRSERARLRRGPQGEESGS